MSSVDYIYLDAGAYPVYQRLIIADRGIDEHRLLSAVVLCGIGSAHLNGGRHGRWIGHHVRAICHRVCDVRPCRAIERTAWLQGQDSAARFLERQLARGIGPPIAPM